MASPLSKKLIPTEVRKRRVLAKLVKRGYQELRRGLPRGLTGKYLSIRLHKSWYQVETSRGPQHKALCTLRCSQCRSVPTSSELLIRVPANLRLDLLNFRDQAPSLRTIQDNQHSDVLFETYLRFRFYF